MDAENSRRWHLVVEVVQFVLSTICIKIGEAVLKEGWVEGEVKRSKAGQRWRGQLGGFRAQGVRIWH